MDFEHGQTTDLGETEDSVNLFGASPCRPTLDIASEGLWSRQDLGSVPLLNQHPDHVFRIARYLIFSPRR